MRIPSATYRLQFNRDFTFEQGIAIIDYLRGLGISEIYSSPVLKAAPSSSHGYDVCSFEEVNPYLGGEPGFNALTGKLQELGMGLLLDFVPNHMGTDCTNAWLTDVLAKGQDSQFGSWFDIDWNSPFPGLKGKVLLPTLEDLYGKVLDAGKLRLNYVSETNEFQLTYYDRSLPLRASTQDQLRAEVSAKGLEKVLAAYNGKPGHHRSFDALHDLLDQQNYHLAWWRLAPQIINYRRFFDVTELIAVRMELPEVFSAAHRLVARWCKQGKITGMRIDHPDGLFDPRDYFERLQSAAAEERSPTRQPFYVVVEKILTRDERLPADWPVAGTTGYDFLNQANGLFVDAANEQRFTDLYREFTGFSETFEDAARAGKKKVLRSSFLSELDGLTRQLLEMASATRSGRDLTFHALREGLGEIIAAFPVYRTYVTRDSKLLSEVEQLHVKFAIEEARTYASPLSLPAINWIGSQLLLQTPPDQDDRLQASCRALVLKLQQLTGPVTAKGIEDTAFYNYNRLVSLNEVGGDPGRFGISVEAFHSYNEVTTRSWPHSLLASATHDTKRGEDVRARINVLSEMPDQWRSALRQWKELNERHKTEIAGRLAPDSNDEYLLYQTLLGAWLDEAGLADNRKEFTDRVCAYLLKATREAKRNTSWTDPNADYEQATKSFVERVLDPAVAAGFHKSLQPFLSTVAFFGRINSLSQTLLKLTSPGVPDLYQGTELWDLNLVDPDNRRPVDFKLRREALEGVKRWDKAQAKEVTAESKMFLIWRSLQLRNQHHELFDHGDYIPLSAEGEKANHICAFARRKHDFTSITIVPRLVYGLANGQERMPLGDLWSDTSVALPKELRAMQFTNVLTGDHPESFGEGNLPIHSILAGFPVGLLIGRTTQ